MAHKLQPDKRHRIWLVAVMVCGVTIFASLVLLTDLKKLHNEVEQWNGALVFLMLALFPLFGAPVSILYIISGAKFGHVWGLIIAGLAISVHLVGSYWIAHSYLRKPLDWLFSKTRYRMPQVPEGEYVPVSLLTCLMPGAPYTVKNYLLALAGTPFRPYFLACLPAHLFTASIAIFFGDFAGEMTRPRIIFLSCYAVVLFALSRYVVRRLKRRKLKKIIG